LCLDAVGRVSEDPAAAAAAEAVAGLLAEAAAPAGADTRDKHALAFEQRGDCRAGGDDHADSLVAEDRARRHLGDVALEDVQVGAADRRAADADDRVGRRLDRRVRHELPGLLARAVIDERLHRVSLFGWLGQRAWRVQPAQTRPSIRRPQDGQRRVVLRDWSSPRVTPSRIISAATAVVTRLTWGMKPVMPP